MYAVETPDGVELAVERRGDGPPLVLVHGAVADARSTWGEVTPHLASEFTVHAVHRRGRPPSGDGDDHGLNREVADLLAVLDAPAAPAALLGHSYGALVAFEAARRRGDALRGLVLYGGVPVYGPAGFDLGAVDRLDAHLGAGDREALLVAALREVAGMSEDRVAALREQAAWERRLEFAHTVPREFRALAAHEFDPADAADVACPTALLAGGQRGRTDHAERVADALPRGTLRVLEGAGDTAMHADPERFAAVVRDLPPAPQGGDGEE